MTRSDHFLSCAFQEHIDVIRLLRASDPTLDDICREFEEIALAKHQIEIRSKDSQPSELLDLAHTLDALRVEIQQILAGAGSKTPTQRKPE